MSSRAMEAVKDKMLAMKEKTEEFLERDSEAKQKLKKVEEEAFSKENEAAGHNRRIQLLQKKLSDINAEIVEKQKICDKHREKKALEESKGQELSYAEVETDEQLRTIEVQVQEAQCDAENATMKLTDAQRRLTFLENELYRADLRKERAIKRIPELEKMIRSAAENLRKLEQGDALASERETDSEQKIKLLEEEVVEKTKAFEATQRKEATSLRRINELTSEIEKWEEKKKRIEDEMVEMAAL